MSNQRFSWRISGCFGTNRSKRTVLRASQRGRPSHHRALRMEVLEERSLLAAGLAIVDVNADQIVRSIDDPFLGVNVAWWDYYLNTSHTQQMVQDAGLGLFRMPGGATSDAFHFDDLPRDHGTYRDKSAAEMATFIASVNGDAVVTLDYGSGSPQEAAAFLAYLNAPTTSTADIGPGQEWNDADGWVSKDWQTAGYWAAVRAATPKATNDGLNFLRIGRSAPFGFRNFEVGNEVYGSWEIDHHGEGGEPGQPHDPATYVAFAKLFAGLAQQIDPTISVGLDTGAVDAWTSNVLHECAVQGFTPGFLSDHSYAQEPGSENDATLLLHTVSDPANASLAWTNRAAGYRNLLQQTLGDAASGVELLATEFNSVSPDPGTYPGKQTTSLVNGLFTADSLGSLLQAGYAGGVFWDLRNDFKPGNNSASLYGWRQGGDLGLLGNNGPAPSTGPYVPYPTYFAEQLVSKMVHPGDTMVQAQSNDPDLGVYAVRQGNGHLDLLVLNKNATTDLTATFQVLGFHAMTQAQVWQYGKAQDDAQSRTLDGHSALASFVTNVALDGPNFTETFPSYSMTVIDLAAMPNVTAVSPTKGPAAGGTKVTILGTNLATAKKVLFGSKAAKIKSRADTQIVAVSPAGEAGTVHVTVVTAYGTATASAADQFTYIAAPTLTAVSPNAGPIAGDTTLTITGSNLAQATAVMFGKVVVSSFTSDADNQIEVLAPAAAKAGTVDIRVVTAGGTSKVSAADKYTYVALPSVTKISPTAGPTGGETKVTITGKNLAKATKVLFGTIEARVTRNSATQIVAVSPAGAAGTVDVTVVTAGGTSAILPADQFAYVEAPTVTGVDPLVGSVKGGTKVTILGTNLTRATKVFFGNKAVTRFISTSDTQIVLTTPAGKAGTVDIRVVTPGGTSAVTSNDAFTYTSSPTASRGLPLGSAGLGLGSSTRRGGAIVPPEATDAAILAMIDELSPARRWRREIAD